MRRLASALAAVAALGAQGCLFGNDCDCPPRRNIPLPSGHWTGTSTAIPSGYKGAGISSERFPHGDETRQLVVDRDAGVVTFTAQVDGSTVVERWRIRPR